MNNPASHKHVFFLTLFATHAWSAFAQDHVIPEPHPVLSEVMFNVPRGAAGDATGDGDRNATGDEFVELHNHHAKEIDLTGYTITNWLTTDDSNEKRGVRFTFPRFKLGPGETVVIFNGYKSSIRGPKGSKARAPRKTNENFNDAWVFSMGNTSKNNAWNNSDDFALLTDPQGEKVEAVVWGNTQFQQVEDALRISEVTRNAGGSVQREHPDDDPIPHVDIDGETFSPGTMIEPEQQSPVSPPPPPAPAP